MPHPYWDAGGFNSWPLKLLRELPEKKIDKSRVLLLRGSLTFKLAVSVISIVLIG